MGIARRSVTASSCAMGVQWTAVDAAGQTPTRACRRRRTGRRAAAPATTPRRAVCGGRNGAWPPSTLAAMGRRSTGWGARKAAASGGTLTAPCAAAVRAAMKAGNLPSARPTRGRRRSGTAPSRATASRASPPYISDRPSSASVGDTEAARLDPVADALQGLQHLPEGPAVGGLVRFDDDRAGLAREGLFDRHAHHCGGRRGQRVEDDGAAPVPADDEQGRGLEGGPAEKLNAGAQMGNEYAGDPHEASLTSNTDGEGMVEEYMFYCQGVDCMGLSGERVSKPCGRVSEQEKGCRDVFTSPWHQSATIDYGRGGVPQCALA